MSIHWTLVAGFLYIEIGIILLLLVPFISSRMWTRILRSNLVRGLETQLVYYFYVLIAILILLFLDSIREMRKYSNEELLNRKVGLSHLDTQMQMQMRLFRAQRNYYIAGFALFLLLVIKKLISLVTANAGLQTARAVAVRQAEAAAGDVTGGGGGGGDSLEIRNLKKCLETSQKEAEAAKKEVLVLKRRSESIARDYDRLMEKDKVEKKKTNSMFGWKKN